MCCDMLGVVGSSLKMVKFGPTTPNTSQQVATGWPNARNMLRPTMLRYVELACCDRLAGALGQGTEIRIKNIKMKYTLATETGASILCKNSSTQKKSNFSTKRNAILSVFP